MDVLDISGDVGKCGLATQFKNNPDLPAATGMWTLMEQEADSTRRALRVHMFLGECGDHLRKHAVDFHPLFGGC